MAAQSFVDVYLVSAASKRAESLSITLAQRAARIEAKTMIELDILQQGFVGLKLGHAAFRSRGRLCRSRRPERHRKEPNAADQLPRDPAG